MLLVALLLILEGLLSTVTFAEPQKCRLTVLATPFDSTIKIMDIGPKYYPGILLECGWHNILVEKPGYISFRGSVEVIHQEGQISVPLDKISHSTFEAVKAGTLEHKEKTLSVLDNLFQSRQADYLDKISTSHFQQSKWYKELQKYVESYHLNLNHASETATQEFIINGNDRHVLVVDFDQSKETNLWYIADAYVKKGRQQQVFTRRGFRPNEFERHFSALVQKIQNGQIWPYYSLAPHGKLNSSFFKGKTLSLSREKSIKVKDIIIHDGNNRIIDVIFLTLRYYPAGYREGAIYKSGWLIDGGGPVKALYNPGENLYLDIITNQDLDLNAPNEGLIFFNLGELD